MFLAKFSALCFFIGQSKAVAPEECFANFRWDDCGQTPEPVIYYWKPGSRCEVGTWRGCLPNPNMFQNEYECARTCIFNNELGQEPIEDQNFRNGSSEAIEIEGIKNDTEKSVSSDNGEGSSKNVSTEYPDTKPIETSSTNDTIVPEKTTILNDTTGPEDTIVTSDSNNDFASNGTFFYDETANEKKIANETSTNNTVIADDLPASNNTLDPDKAAGSNKSDVQEDEANKQDKEEDTPEETPAQLNADGEPDKEDENPDEEKKPLGRSKLASVLKGN